MDVESTSVGGAASDTANPSMSKNNEIEKNVEMSKEQVEGKGEGCEERVGSVEREVCGGKVGCIEQEVCGGKGESVEQENGGQNSMGEVKGAGEDGAGAGNNCEDAEIKEENTWKTMSKRHSQEDSDHESKSQQDEGGTG